jgi:rod shape determining protein RodA
MTWLKFVDWGAFGAALVLSLLGALTMLSIGGDNTLFFRQLIWIGIAAGVCIAATQMNPLVLRNTALVTILYALSLVTLLLILLIGEVTLGAQSRFDIGPFSIQPSDPIKIILIITLAKYFARRHIEIARLRHVIVSGVYTLLIFGLVFLQPDFGSAAIIFCIWLGMVLVAGIPLRHLLAIFFLGVVAFSGLWFGVFQEYQKDRIRTFINPLTDITGTGYNAYQSTVAVGSGEILGKGIGEGTQSKLSFLPEYETDFIFAAFAEEWGFVGVLLVLALFGVLIWRVLRIAIMGATNFETLYGAGFAILIITHVGIHAGMNMGLLPVTGITIPFMSYGGSHLIMEFGGLGILMAMQKVSRGSHKEDLKREFLGGV